MAIVYGRVLDPELLGMHASAVELMFELNDAQFRTDGAAIAQRSVKVIPEEFSGEFTVNLASNESIVGDSWYTLRARWLDPNMGWCEWSRRLWVPNSGGQISDLVQATPGAWQVLVSATQPVPLPTGALWFNPATSDLYRRTMAGVEHLANLKGQKGDRGIKGDKGDPGMNAVPVDEGVAFLLGAGTVTGPELEKLTNRYAAPGAALIPSAVIVDGDSLTEHFDARTGLFRGSWFTHLHAESGGVVRLTRNAAVSGADSAALAGQFDASVLAHDPSMVIVMAGRNDTEAPAPVAAFVRSVVAKCRERGISVVLVNTVPQGRQSLAAPASVSADIFPGTGGSWPGGVAYEFKVTACTATRSPLAVTHETVLSTTAGVTPTLVVGGATQIKVSWAHVPGANAYRIYQKSGAAWLLADTIYPDGAVQSEPTAHHRWFVSPPALGAAAPTVDASAIAGHSQTNRARLNAWHAKFAAEEGIPLVDVYSALAGATGLWRNGLTYDGTHPSPEGNAVIGKTVAETIQPLVKPAPPVVTASGEDPLNMVTDGLFQTGGGTLPAGWSHATNPAWDSANQVVSRAARTGFAGNAVKHTLTKPGAGLVQSPLITSGFAAGDRIKFALKCELTIPDGAATFLLHDQTGAAFAMLRWSHVTRGVRAVEVIGEVPAGATSIGMRMSQTGAGDVYFGQVTVYNESAQAWINV